MADFWADIERLPRDPEPGDDGLFDGDGWDVSIVPRDGVTGAGRRMTVCWKNCAINALLQSPASITGAIVRVPALMGPERAAVFEQLVSWLNPSEVCFWADPDPLDALCFLRLRQHTGGVACRWLELPERYGGVEIPFVPVERRILQLMVQHSVEAPVSALHRERWARGVRIELDSQVLRREWTAADVAALYGP